MARGGMGRILLGVGVVGILIVGVEEVRGRRRAAEAGILEGVVGEVR